MSQTSVAVIVGSIRRESINRKLAEGVAALGRDRFAFSLLRIDDLPLFNQDHEKDPPPPVVRMKGAVTGSDAVLFVTPEHNRSIPAALKNAIDWGSRPPGTSCWGGKPAAIMGTSRGAISTAAAQQHLRAILGNQDMAVMGQPEAFIQFKDGLIAEDGTIADEGLRKFLDGYLAKFAGWVARFKAAV